MGINHHYSYTVVWYGIIRALAHTAIEPHLEALLIAVKHLHK